MWNHLINKSQLKNGVILRIEFVNENRLEETYDFKVLDVRNHCLLIEQYRINDSRIANNIKTATVLNIANLLEFGYLIEED